ncbi:transposase [Alteribacillus sp. HJP-4]|uniref:transposase n=1 Tax=Alteribacillus sp. HJP-4 TaxID=2775394 RepID=UPI0035CD2AEE
MTRKYRIRHPGLTYHIVARGIRQSNLFLDTKDFGHYLYLLTKSKEVYDYDLHAYCLMSNHIHLLIETFTDDISSIMHRLQTNYAIYFNSKYKVNGHVFQGRFYSDPMKDETHFFEVGRYIHLNPVLAEITADPADYRWCSARTYLLPMPEDQPQHPLLSISRTLHLFPSPRHDQYRSYLFQRLKDSDLSLPCHPI